MHRPYCLPLWCATLLLVAVATGARAQVDPKALVQKQFETLARGDVAGAWAHLRVLTSMNHISQDQHGVPVRWCC